MLERRIYIISEKLQTHHVIKVTYYLRIYFCICRNIFYKEDSGSDENLFMAECVKCGEWYHKVCLEFPSRVFYEKMCRVETFGMLEHNIKIEKKTEFFRLKLVRPNDKDTSYVYQFLSSFFSDMNLWPDFLHFKFVSHKSTCLLQILKLIIGNVRILCIGFLKYCWPSFSIFCNGCF